jgi:hypothetical protein
LVLGIAVGGSDAGSARAMTIKPSAFLGMKNDLTGVIQEIVRKSEKTCYCRAEK